MNQVDASLWAADIGNTRISFGAWRGAWSERFSLPTSASEEAVASALSAHAHAASAIPLIISSVAPSASTRLRQACARLPERVSRCFELGRDGPIPIENRTLKPEQTGPDRLVNALAAYHHAQGPAIVVDAGTAITLDIVSPDGAFIGGAIAPGVMLGLRALHQNTERLPHLPPAANPRAIGRTTEEAIHSGIFHGYVGLVRELLRQAIGELGGRPRVIATGGDAAYLAPSVPEIDEVMPDLTLDGIRLAWETLQRG